MKVTRLMGNGVRGMRKDDIAVWGQDEAARTRKICLGLLDPIGAVFGV